MDATPVTLGQEFGGYAAQIRYGMERLLASLPRRRRGAARRHRGRHRDQHPARVRCRRDRESTPHDRACRFTEARNHFEAQGCPGRTGRGLGSAAHARREPVQDLQRPALDGIGPEGRAGEISLPDLQPGSSIMPGKVNPVICRGDHEVCAQVIGNDTTVAFAGAQGNFELNVMFPVIARNLLESIQPAGQCHRLLADRCVDGIMANVERCRALRRILALDRHAAEQVHRVRGGRQGRQAGAQGKQDDSRRGVRKRLRRRRHADRGATRCCPRRALDDPAAGLAQYQPWADLKLQAPHGLP